MKAITESDYAAGIPKCCSVQTMDGHAEMMLCWGLVKALENEVEMDCGGCPLRKAEAQDHE